MGKRGERKLQILQTLAGMLEQPAAEKITTAALAAMAVERYATFFMGISLVRCHLCGSQGADVGEM